MLYYVKRVSPSDSASERKDMMNARENIIRILKHDHPEYMPEVGKQPFVYLRGGIMESPEEGGLDDWGVEWLGGGDTPIYPNRNGPIKDLAELKSFKFPDPYQPGLFDDTKEAIAQADRENNLLVANLYFGVFERAWLLLGLENALMYMVIHPEEMKWLFAKIADFKIAITKQFIELGVDAILFGDDWGTQKSLFVKPELWREQIKPEQARMYKPCKDKGIWVIQHTDGHVEEIIPDLIEIGMDCWNPCQPWANDLAGLKRLYGDKLTFWGGIDSQRVLPLGTPEEVKAEVKTRIEELGTNGGYIPGPSHVIPFPEANTRAMNETIREYGQYKR